ncbi:butyrophilin subfamily 1 member A1-like isoform X2 [Brachyhypopomus gauderio]|uniref:butyrophilin subfamily 1 member A1-like isoform X2 n=1 Tax=Brachyhypopomus gauderio TaxID=698409 RepID=UPI0040412354
MYTVMLVFLFMVHLLSCADCQTNLFSVRVHDGFISALLGSSVLLSCTISPSVDCKSYEVRWYRPDKYNSLVLLYKDQRVQENTGDIQYRNRVSLVGELEKGNVSLQLENLTLADRGEYVCFVKSIEWYDKASMILNITVIGSHPLLSLADAGDQVNVTCVSDGWSPKPKLTWRDRGGRKLNSVEHYETDFEGLVSVSSWVLFSPSGSDWISCSVGLSEQEMKESRVVPLKPRKNFTARENEPTSSSSEPGPWHSISNKISGEGEVLLIESSKQKSPTVDKATNTQDHFTDWSQMILRKVNLTLDSETAPDCLNVNKDGKQVTCTATGDRETLPELTHVFCRERFKTGQHYWQMKMTFIRTVLNRTEKSDPVSWYVGVTSVPEKKRIPLTPQNGFWLFCYKKEKGYYVCGKNQTPVLVRDRFTELGVFLDCELHTLSFFDCDTQSHLYTFYSVNSTQPLIPVIGPDLQQNCSFKLD